MALPQVSGTFSGHLGSTGVAALDISGVANGSWMVVSALTGIVGMTITPPTGWTTLVDAYTTGTRLNYLYVKLRTAGDGNTATFTQNSSNYVSYGLMWGTGSDSVANWTMGTSWKRSTDSVEASGSRYNNVAKSINTTTSDCLVLAISHESTLAMTQSNEIAAVAPTGWTQRIYLPQVAVNDRIETIWMATKTLPTAGASGDVTITYTSPQDSNGWGVQLSIPGVAAVQPTNPIVVGTPTTFVGNTTTGLTIARPTGATSNDYVVVAIRGQSSTGTVGPASSGFTRLGPAFVANSTSYRINGFYGRPISDISTEPSSYDFTFTTGTGSIRFVATAFLVRGIDLTTPLAGFFDSYGSTAITNGRQVDSYGLSASPALSLFMGASEFATPNDHVPLTLPTGYSVISTVVTTTNLASSRTYLWVGSKVESTTVTPASISWGVVASAAAEGISLRGASSVAPDPDGPGYAALNGSGVAVKLYHTTAAGARTPSNVVPMRRGFNTVTQLLAKHGATWAHRGGSVSYPEMSLHGYTQSVVRGYGALEVSLARTSDGVWFGLHDQTTDRTSGGTYGNASSQTWAQVQAQQNVAGPGAAQPYMRWEEIVAAYGSTHVIIADPKYALGSYRTEFLNMVNRDIGPARGIIKYSGAGSGAAALSTAAQAMGFQTWGFFYASDASAAQGGNGALQTWGPSWTILGMEYGASQAIWDEAIALGKPVVGHIAQSQAAYDMAMAKGATNVQVSGVGVVAPVSWWTP